MVEWKVKKIMELGIDLMIDDCPEVLSALPPHIKRLWMADPEVFNLKSCVTALKADNRIKTI
jgi:hypothetical protein